MSCYTEDALFLTADIVDQTIQLEIDDDRIELLASAELMYLNEKYGGVILNEMERLEPRILAIRNNPWERRRHLEEVVRHVIEVENEMG
jgi:hypothetical protein